MDNRICQLFVKNVQLSPAQAEVWITVVPEYRTPTTELRGRLMGPRCAFASTVKVAYPLRPLLPSQESTVYADSVARRVIIPEANFWEPQCPFFYEGPVEFWQDGLYCDRMILRHGLRSLDLTERGLYVNGRRLLLQGRAVSACSDEEVLALRQAGCNLLVAPVTYPTLSLWERADRLGFLMLGLVRDDSNESVQHLDQLSAHPSCLGWLVDPTDDFSPLHALPERGYVGLLCDAPPKDEALLSEVAFVFGPLELANLGKPLLVKGEGSPHSSKGCPILGNVL